MNTSNRVLIIDDNVSDLKQIKQMIDESFDKRLIDIKTAFTWKLAKPIMTRQEFDLIIINYIFSPYEDGYQTINEILALSSEVQIFLYSVFINSDVKEKIDQLNQEHSNPNILTFTEPLTLDDLRSTILAFFNIVKDKDSTIH